MRAQVLKTLSVRITPDLFHALCQASAAAECASLSAYVERTLARSISPLAPQREGTTAKPKLTARNRRHSYARLFQQQRPQL